MQWLTFTLRLESDLGGPLRGDSLFGQFCWALRLRAGENALDTALAGYTQGHPFLILSDGFPKGFAPRPEVPTPPVPLDRISTAEEWSRRKKWAARACVPLCCLDRPLVDALRADDLAKPETADTVLQSHNTINRMTGTTGTGIFAPYQTSRLLGTGQEIEVHCLHDPERIAQTDVADLMADLGLSGCGRDASIGLGKFSIVACLPRAPDRATGAVVALAPCRPAPGEVEPAHSYWRPFTRFGRHGGPAFGGNVFKAPLLLADTGAVFTLSAGAHYQRRVGVGLGGDGRLSRHRDDPIRLKTVHQAYAPVLPVDLEGWHG